MPCHSQVRAITTLRWNSISNHAGDSNWFRSGVGVPTIAFRVVRHIHRYDRHHNVRNLAAHILIDRTLQDFG